VGKKFLRIAALLCPEQPTGRKPSISISMLGGKAKAGVGPRFLPEWERQIDGECLPPPAVFGKDPS
jgi:hypothetical protein